MRKFLIVAAVVAVGAFAVAPAARAETGMYWLMTLLGFQPADCGTGDGTCERPS